VQASLARAGGERWLASFHFVGQLDGLRIPAPEPAQRADGLWRHLCAELFVMAPDGRYVEFNFAPSGLWAAYLFDGYRSGMHVAELPVDPVVTCRRNAAVLELEAVLVLPPAVDAVTTRRIALCAMVEETDGTLSCWAQRHAAGRPDFHHADGFMTLHEESR
jgi:hypothetical protein